VVNTMNYVAKLTKTRKIYAVLGGAHLLRASDLRMERTIEAFSKEF
jgi:7,8-dihydropterin-6-yl-methyl-4-(beta-D-ribofuranosyl)aminobenzene 5'-phosphate synthase